jgi:hypothetical protein
MCLNNLKLASSVSAESASHEALIGSSALDFPAAFHRYGA